MTNKDYALIADAILREYMDTSTECIEARSAMYNLAGAIGTALRRDNPDFDYYGFMGMCGL